MRIAGIMIPDEKRLDIALTYIYGIGRNNVKNVLTKAQVEPSKKVKSLSEEEQRRVQKSLEELKTGDTLVVIKTANNKHFGVYRLPAGPLH